MAEQKRFYWIKLKESFFINNEVTDWIISQPNGCEYIVLYLKLCILTANKGGRLAMEIGEMLIPYDAQKIAADTKFDIDTVIVAMELFKKIGLIYEEADGVLKIPYVEEIVGSETPAAERMRKSRAKKLLSSGEETTRNNVTKTRNNVTQRKRTDKDKRDKEIKILDSVADEEEGSGISKEEHEYRSKLEIFRDKLILNDYQVEELLKIMGLEVFEEYVERFNNYVNKTGYTIKNHYETLLRWYEEDSGIRERRKQ